MLIEKFTQHRFFRTVVITALSLAALPAINVSAQTTTGTVRGTVTSGGTAVGNAQILLRNPATGVQRGTTSRDDGAYVLPGLPPATYEMTVRRIGSAPE